MREVKCKAWDKKNKKWIGASPLEYLCVSGDVVVLVTYISNHVGSYEVDSVNHLTHDEVNNLEIVQYTGHKNEDGIEIYEGDIVDKIYYKKATVRYQVIWDEWGWSLSPIKDYYPIKSGGGWFQNLTGVGNIHENPKLLENENEKTT